MLTFLSYNFIVLTNSAKHSLAWGYAKIQTKLLNSLQSKTLRPFSVPLFLPCIMVAKVHINTIVLYYLSALFGLAAINVGLRPCFEIIHQLGSSIFIFLSLLAPNVQVFITICALSIALHETFSKTNTNSKKGFQGHAPWTGTTSNKKDVPPVSTIIFWQIALKKCVAKTSFLSIYFSLQSIFIFSYHPFLYWTYWLTTYSPNQKVFTLESWRKYVY